uniref:Uncharacterized protein n=1 Tax=Romanomermis culicivorax TaxID=13658 RepID=A0A915L3M9_ROMCU
MPFLSAAYKNDMSYPAYVYIVPEYNTLTSTPWEPWLQPGVSEDDAAYYQQVFQKSKTVRLLDHRGCLYLATILIMLNLGEPS